MADRALPIHGFHDRTYKLLLDHPRTVWDLLTGFIGGDPADLLDERTLEQMPTEFVDESLIGSRGDMLRRVRFRDGPEEWLYLLVLLELQSTVDTHMAVRVAAFIGRIYLRLVRNGRTGPRGRLPPVLPIVLYNGHPSWTAVADVRDLVARADGRLEELQLRSGYVLLDVHRMEVGALPPDNVVSLRVRLERESGERFRDTPTTQWSSAHGPAPSQFPLPTFPRPMAPAHFKDHPRRPQRSPQPAIYSP